jgi:hypothetical protein
LYHFFSNVQNSNTKIQNGDSHPERSEGSAQRLRSMIYGQLLWNLNFDSVLLLPIPITKLGNNCFSEYAEYQNTRIMSDQKVKAPDSKGQKSKQKQISNYHFN